MTYELLAENRKSAIDYSETTFLGEDGSSGQRLGK
jgi:hypothetical protein